ncbi:hypothetical protein EX30DRAFT_340534 [Ascodesmis nigricans]|uniref:Uncharacterized protein n=1 Tax=Ascodesmis nigricans TaxID=341454 RepID=A0A4S2MY66_9PEZI|nr:hypothetical protein EX30DRAFT_340534 [Ascodesmis nigricans]
MIFFCLTSFLSVCVLMCGIFGRGGTCMERLDLKPPQLAAIVHLFHECFMVLGGIGVV